MSPLIVTIDGPAASGKSTVAQKVAQALNGTFLDTGAMYRAVTLLAMNTETDLSDEPALIRLIEENQFSFTPAGQRLVVLINQEDVTEQLRSPEVTANIRHVAEAPGIRNFMVRQQRTLALKYQRVVTEGRDQGTVAFPDAQVKIFLTADPEERAKRRQIELEAAGIQQDLDTLLKAVEARDLSDRQRSVGPLKPADDAIHVDTTNLTLDEVVQAILKIVEEKVGG